MAEAIDAFQRATQAVNEAEEAYLKLIADYPDDMEAQGQYPDLLHHWNAPRGRSMDGAREPCAQVLAADPEFACPTWHVVDLAVREEDWAEADTLFTPLAILALWCLRAARQPIRRARTPRSCSSLTIHKWRLMIGSCGAWPWPRTGSSRRWRTPAAGRSSSR